MITVGSDCQMKVFDIRNLYKELYQYFIPFEAK